MHPTVKSAAQKNGRSAPAGYKDQQNNMTSANETRNSKLSRVGWVLLAMLLVPELAIAQTVMGGAQAGWG